MRDEVRIIIEWFDGHRRDLPWRAPNVSPWGVMVSEFMLQQTPTSRVVRPWLEWLERWPMPEDLASEPSSAAVAAWGRLGYPRRALRLHEAATAISAQGGEVPDSFEELLALPGVGRYTAAAIASFAFGQRHVVLDTNVRRVLARLDGGVEFPPNHASAAEYRQGQAWLPDDPADAARWAAASMELGAVVCTARSPRCDDCPVAHACNWRKAGYPPFAGPARRSQTWEGTDRQCRGHLLDVVRNSASVDIEELTSRWPDPRQAKRCVDSLARDGLIRVSGSQVTL